MIKKIVTSVLVVVLVFAFAACGDSESPQKSEGSGNKDSQNSNIEGKQDSGTEVVGGKTNSDDEMEEFSETLTFMGYNFNYPEGWFLDDYTYGYTLHNKNFFTLLEAPAIAAVLLDVTDVNDAPTAVEEYVLKTIETRVVQLFNFDETTQTITNSEVKTINNVEMLRVEGIFTNIAKNRDTPLEVPFVGYYFLRDNQPVYFVGVSINEDITIDAFMDEFAGYVIDIKE